MPARDESILPNLAGSLGLLQRKLTPAFVSGAQFGRLKTQALKMPAIHRAGFEYRLGPHPQGLDLQQAFNLEHGDGEVFLDGNLPQEHYLQGLTAFCARWRRPDSQLHTQLRQLWLEFDCSQAHPGNSREPSIFISLSKRHTDPAVAREVIGEAHELLTQTARSDRLQTQLAQVIDASPRRDGISHVGFMLSRHSQAIRLVIPFFDAPALLRLLESVGWRASKAELAPEIAWLFERFSEVRLCLDVADGVSQSLGFECFFKASKKAGTAHQAILDDLVSAGYCESRQRDALLAWPERLTPADGCGDWPDDLVLRSITCDERDFTVIDCRLSHLKFSWMPGEAMTAKAYFGYLENQIHQDQAGTV